MGIVDGAILGPLLGAPLGKPLGELLEGFPVEVSVMVLATAVVEVMVRRGFVVRECIGETVGSETRGCAVGGDEGPVGAATATVVFRSSPEPESWSVPRLIKKNPRQRQR